MRIGDQELHNLDPEQVWRQIAVVAQDTLEANIRLARPDASAADMIRVLDAGRVVESGNHTQLLARRGFYARLVERQMGGV